MTQEEKAKAYDEVLERAKSLLSGNQLGNAWIYKLLPELSESKDEKIRKELIRAFKSFNSIKIWNGIECTDILTWLEKQGKQGNNEDSDILQRFSFYSYKDEPNILYLAGLYVNDEYRNKGIGTKILEVANEVAKSLNCYSIRLKTKKDSNAERLYRTHGYNNLATEERDEIWLEKQAEQKQTAEEVLIKAGLKPYKDGDQWCILLGDNIQEGICGFGNTIEDALYAFLKDLITSQGEQKSNGTFVNVDDVREDFIQEVYRILDADSTNDRANQIIDAFDNLPTVTIEKQDEQSPIVDKVEPKFNVGNIIRHKEQGFTCKITGINIDTAEYEVSECSGIHLPFDFQDAYELVEQKPVECNEDNLPEFENYLCLMFQKFRTKGICTNGEIIDYVEEHAQKLKDTLCHAWSEEDEARFESCIKVLQTSDGYDTINVKWLKSLKTRIQPQQEWSKEDIETISRVISIVKWAAYSDHSHPILNDEGATELVERLNSLKGRVQPKQEWSEEDIMRIDNLIAIIENKGYPDYVEYLEKLKDRVQPQPQQQWSEEDEDMRYKATAVINRLCADGKEYVWSISTLEKLFYWLKSLRPQSTWKPSDEEMKALHDLNLTGNISYAGQGQVLIELYNDLKKLKG